MGQEKVLIIGLGEIGHTLFALLSEAKESLAVYGLDLDQAKMVALGQSKDRGPSKIDTLHVCLPSNNQKRFAEVVAAYVNQFKQKLTIINSTVPPGTTLKVDDKCKCLIAHSPARGVHKSAEHMIWENEAVDQICWRHKCNCGEKAGAF